MTDTTEINKKILNDLQLEKVKTKDIENQLETLDHKLHKQLDEESQNLEKQSKSLWKNT